MIRQTDVIEFFDALAPGWDAETVVDDDVIRTVLDHAGVVSGCKVLDVATGTGVLIPYYLAREVSSVTAVDISPEMLRVARQKFPEPAVRFILGDAETAVPDCDFDAIVIYNALPHFPDAERLIASLSTHLRTGGTLTVAHGASREVINAHHKERAQTVSNGLMEAAALADVFSKYLSVAAVISDSRMYLVSGKKL